MGVSEALLRAVALGQPGARLQRIVDVADPAPGAEFTFTVPGESVWRPVALRCRLVTDVNVASRVPFVIVDDGTDELVRVVPQASQTASSDRVYTWTPGVGPGHATVVGEAPWQPFPWVALPAGYRVRSTTNAMQAGDQYSAIRLWVEELVTFDPRFLAVLRAQLDAAALGSGP